MAAARFHKKTYMLNHLCGDCPDDLILYSSTLSILLVVQYRGADCACCDKVEAVSKRRKERVCMFG